MPYTFYSWKEAKIHKKRDIYIYIISSLTKATKKVPMESHRMNKIIYTIFTSLFSNGGS